jgi:hypothetical protein
MVALLLWQRDYTPILPVDFDTFRKVQEQDKIRGKRYAAQAAAEARIRERVMFIQSHIEFYSQPGYPRAEAERLKYLMNQTFNDLRKELERNCPVDLYHRLIHEDRDLTLEAIIAHYGRHPLPQRRDSPAYQSLHSRTKSQWGITRADDNSKF